MPFLDKQCEECLVRARGQAAPALQAQSGGHLPRLNASGNHCNSGMHDLLVAERNNLLVG